MTAILVLMLVCLVIAGSIYLRVSNYRNTLDGVETRSSPLALAVQEMVATAGGLYLSLIMLVSFLKIDLPSKILFQGITVDPAALLSIGLTVLQPLFFRIFKN